MIELTFMQVPSKEKSKSNYFASFKINFLVKVLILLQTNSLWCELFHSNLVRHALTKDLTHFGHVLKIKDNL